MLRGGSANPNYPAPQNDPSPPITVVLTILLLVFFLMGFFAIYFCRCMVENCLTSFQRRPSGERVGPTTPPKEGLDHSLIESFPTLVYASVKEFRIDKYGLECAICLVEFEDDSMLRLLTVCCHVFHQECIDLWLESHKTCPFCRRNLESSPPSLAEKSPVLAHREGNESMMLDQDAIRIDIHEDQVVEEKEHQKVEENERERFTRSHSTGHSIVRRREEEDRYTLRLPEHVKIKIVRGHKWTGSCTTFREFSRQRDHPAARGFGELSGSKTTTSTHATASAGDI